ncbi:MAG: toll/interleukin-1 receptor domain-containing protein, partial [Chloroflexi bacterium]|nr:toll/interleukin-1 receptor domain-containing protein [Chloroflexota bacterium]
MRRYEFFFSYARADTDDTLQRFFSDLAGEVAKRAGLGMVAPEDVGFLDTHSLKTGVEWEREIADALQTCNVFVPLYSPNYFNSRFCENEWQRFYDRQNLYMAGHPQEPRPGTLIPVPWIPTKWKPQPYPPRVMTIVYAQPNAPPAYVESGLRQMSRLPSTYGDAYTALVADLAGQIVQAANDFSMPPLPARPTFDDGLNTFSFHSPPGAPVRITEPPLGPRKAMFVIVAARPQDLAGMRKQLDAYGDVGERDWRPFKPPREDSAAYLAV